MRRSCETAATRSSGLPTMAMILAVLALAARIRGSCGAAGGRSGGDVSRGDRGARGGDARGIAGRAAGTGRGGVGSRRGAALRSVVGSHVACLPGFESRPVALVVGADQGGD